jgi:glycosyltransferase involved in cell wall biosynthesis
MAAIPVISTITPVRNGELFITDAVRSITSQAVEVSEIHIVDDGSTDATRSIVEDLAKDDPRIQIHDGPQRGPGPARNVGLNAAKGDCIAFLDCDDMWPQNKLELQIARLQADPEVGMVSGFVKYFDKQDDGGLKPAGDSRTEEIFHVHLGACLYWRHVFEKVGFFDEKFLYSEDVDLMLRIREAGIAFSIMDDITLFYRRHDNSMTSKLTGEEKRDFNRALTLSLMRRKKSGNLTPFKPFRDYVGY